jgi:hypothetical protein
LSDDGLSGTASSPPPVAADQSSEISTDPTSGKLKEGVDWVCPAAGDIWDQTSKSVRQRWMEFWVA